MKKLYTLAHKGDSRESIISADEHAELIKEELGNNVFSSKSKLFQHYMPTDLNKLPDLKFFITEQSRNQSQSIVTFGAGPCILEYFLKLSLPEKNRITATDYDEFMVSRTKEIFTEIDIERFDLVEDDFTEFNVRAGKKYSVAVFFGSMYVMDNQQLVKMLSSLKNNGVKEVYDYHGGYFTLYDEYRYSLAGLFRRIFRRGEKLKGRFHGYARRKMN